MPHAGWISLEGVELFGLPADAVAHIFFGAFFFVFFMSKRVPTPLAMFLVLSIAIGKEIFDNFTMAAGESEWEAIRDIGNSCFGVILYFAISYLLKPTRYSSRKRYIRTN